MIQIQLTPEIEKKFKALKDDFDFITGLGEFIEEEYRLAFELKHDTPESYADSLRADLGEERYQNFVAVSRKKWTKKMRRVSVSTGRSTVFNERSSLGYKHNLSLYLLGVTHSVCSCAIHRALGAAGDGDKSPNYRSLGFQLRNSYLLKNTTS